MGYKELLAAFPNDPSVREVVERRQGYKTELQHLPLVVVLADAFAEEGGRGLRELMAQFADAGVATVPRADFLSEVSPELQKSLSLHIALVDFGLALKSIQAILIEGVYDDGVWCEGYDRVSSGTRLRLAQPSSNQREDIPADKLREMWQFASSEEGKTLVGFLTTRLNLLPRMLLLRLTGSKTLSIIHKTVIPVFEPRARFLVGRGKG